MKDSPNFSLTLTPPLTWAGSTRQRCRVSQTGVSTRAVPGQVFPQSATGACRLRRGANA